MSALKGSSRMAGVDCATMQECPFSKKLREEIAFAPSNEWWRCSMSKYKKPQHRQTNKMLAWLVLQVFGRRLSARAQAQVCACVWLCTVYLCSCMHVHTPCIFRPCKSPGSASGSQPHYHKQSIASGQHSNRSRQTRRGSRNGAPAPAAVGTLFSQSKAAAAYGMQRESNTVTMSMQKFAADQFACLQCQSRGRTWDSQGFDKIALKKGVASDIL